MEKTLKNIDIINITASLQELMNEKLPTKISWNLSKNFKKLSECIKDFTECEKKLIDQYALKNTDGSIKFDENNQFKIIPKHRDVFDKERNELLNCDNVVDILPIKLYDLEGLNIKASILFNLEFMIEEE